MASDCAKAVFNPAFRAALISVLILAFAACAGTTPTRVSQCEELLEVSAAPALAGGYEVQQLGQRRFVRNERNPKGTFEVSSDIQIDGALRVLTIGDSGFARLGSGDSDIGYAASIQTSLLPSPPADVEYAIWSKRGQHFLVASSNRNTLFIDQLGGETVERLCTFARMPDAVISLTQEGDAALCLRHSEANPPPLPDFSGPAIERAGGQLQLDPGVMVHTTTQEMDIDNDGRMELVALASREPIDDMYSRLRFPLVLTSQGSMTVIQRLAERIRALVEREHANSVLPFDLDGQVHLVAESRSFLASQEHEVTRTVIRIEGAVEKQICRITTGPGLRSLNDWDLLRVSNGAVRAGDIDSGWRALFKLEDVAAIRDLFDRSLVPMMNANGESILLAAMRAKRPDVLRLLLESGVDPDTKSAHAEGYRMSPLQEAVWRGSDEDVSTLLQFGADPNGAPLGEAIHRGSASKLELLLKAGAKRVNTVNCDAACTARHLKDEDPKIVLLKKYLPDLEFKRESCATPMKLGICLPET